MSTVVHAQINCKRHWPLAAARMLFILAYCYARRVTVLTLNELSDKQYEAILRRRGWDGTAEVNDHLPGGHWAGNAVVCRTKFWRIEESWGVGTEIDYRKGKKRRPNRMGPWTTRTLTQAAARLRPVGGGKPLVVLAAHVQTSFNSNWQSRQRVVARIERFARVRIANDNVGLIIGADWNNAFPDVEGLSLIIRSGPDATYSNGERVNTSVLPFKRLRRSDHDGVRSKIRFP